MAQPMTDHELLQMVCRGEPAGAEGLFEKYAAPLLRFADRMLNNRAEAEEVTQEVFLKLISRADQYDGRASVSSWLYAIGANACRDRMRRNRRAVVVPIDSVAEAAGREESVESRIFDGQRKAAVRRALDRLSEDQREALVLARYHGLPYAEIARTLNISEGAVKTRIFRAMETLKEFFSEGDSRWNAVTS
jgi:RNA polymerase sigma-70 factor, ECF subfamily